MQRQAGVVGRGRQAVSPFVGRTRELALLHDHLGAAMAGRGQVVGLVGEPGLGKSRLVAEFGRRVTGLGVTVYEGRCLSYGQATPYLPVRNLLRQVCGLAEGDAPAEPSAAVQHRLRASGITAAQDVALLLQLLDLPAAPACLEGLSPEVLQARTFALLRHLVLDAARQQPLVLVVEDLHWSDHTSEAWLASLVERLGEATVLLLGTYRPGYQPPWGGHAAVTQIALAPLRAPDSRAIVQAVLGPVTLPEARLRALVAQAGGNPFFAEELAWHAADQSQGELPGAVPATVQVVLAARMDRLPPEAKYLLQAASVIGTEVPAAQLRAIADLPEAALQHGLTRLHAAEFLAEMRLLPDQAFTFRHALAQEVAYDSLLQERRRALHARLVTALEGLAGDHGAEPVERLAYHALHGAVWDKAMAYARQAGEQALAQAAYQEAAGYLEQALEAVSYLPESRARCEQAIDLRLDLRSALWRLGDWGQVLTYMREAEALAERLGDQRRLAYVLQTLADNCRILSDYAQAFRAGQRALIVARALGDRPLQSEALTTMGQLSYLLGDYGQAVALLQQAVTCLPSEPTPAYGNAPHALWVWPHSWLLRCLSQVGAFAAGQTTRTDILRRAEASDHPLNRAVASYGVGLFCLRQGEIPQAIAVLEQGLAVCRASEIRDWVLTLAASLGYAYAFAGRLSEALPLLEQAVEQYTVMRGGVLSPSLAVWWSEALLCAGRLEEALALARRTLDLARAYRERGTEAQALRLLGATAARSEPPQAAPAEAHYRQALALADELGMRPLQAHCHRGLGTLYADMGRSEQTRDELSAAVALYRAMDMTFWLPQAEAALAQVV